MIDKLETRIPHSRTGPPFTKDFDRMFMELRNDPKGPFRRGEHYELFANLQLYGYDAALHLWSRRGKVPTHKLELLDTGGKTLSGMMREAERIFDVNLLQCAVTRIDLAADVPNVPVSWFKQATSVKWKRYHSGVANAHGRLIEMGKCKPETLYFGKKPNITRVYDKVAEYRTQYTRALRRCSPDQEPPRFEEMFRLPNDSAGVLTRVERVFAAGKVPDCLETIAQLRRNALDFNPFEPMQFLPLPVRRSVSGVSFATECMLEKVQRMIREDGMHFAKRYLYSRANGQGARLWKRLEPHLLCDQAADAGFSKEALLAMYRSSIERQLVA